MTPQGAPHAAPDRRPRRKRIARGSGTTVQQVNQLLSGPKAMQKMMKQMKKGKMPGFRRSSSSRHSNNKGDRWQFA